MPEDADTAKGIVLDTSILIELLRSNPAVQTGLDTLMDKRYAVTTSTACVAELYAGLCPGEETDTAQLISILDCLPLTTEIAIRAGSIKASRAKTGRTHGIVDMMIAATALEFGYAVATSNTRDFDIPELELIDLTRA
jgi:predicted nucleic acid-binding protein